MDLLQSLSNALVLACTYMLIAMGLSMVYGVLKVLHVAHAAVYAVGAFVGVTVYSRLTPLLAEALASQPLGSNLAFWISLIAAMLITGLLGTFIYLGIYRYTWRKSPTVSLVASVGLFIMIQDLLQKPFFLGARQSAYPAGGVGMPRISTTFLSITPTQMLVFVITVILLGIVYVVLNHTRIGLGWKAAAQDPDMAGAVGVNISRVITLNFLIGSMLAGAGGVLVGVYDNMVFATMGDVPSYKAFVVVVLGGLGSLPGTIVASIVLALTETFMITVGGSVLPRDAIAFLVLILLLMFRPTGLLGRA
jgi:branched-chain amino acid transport system permease protein